MILNKIKKFIIKNNLINQNEHIICALSGGIDSTFMFEILHKLSFDMNFKISVCHINHLLRDNDSYEDMLFIQKKCEYNKIIFDCEIINTLFFCEKNKHSIETGARIIRYDYFNKLLNKYPNSKIAIAHNSNDNVETIIFNLLRGCYSLKGIPIYINKIIRPLLNITREDIINFLEANNIKYKIDYTNKINTFSRNKIRNLIFPIFNDINSKYNENILNTYNISKDENNYLNNLANDLIKKYVVFDNLNLKININYFKNIEIFLIRRILLILTKSYFKITIMNTQINNIIKIFFSDNPSAKIIIDNCVFRRQYNIFYIQNQNKKQIINELSLNFINDCNILNKEIELIKEKLYIDINIIHNNNDISNFNSKNNIFYIDYHKINIDSLYLRSRKENDKICLDGLGYRKIKNIFINKKIPLIYRDSIPLLVDKNNIICCLFVGINKYYQITSHTKKILIIKFRSDFYEEIFNR